MHEPAATAQVFGSVLCGSDNGPAGTAARRQAEWLADGQVELAPGRELTAHGPDALAERTIGHDLLVLGSEPAAHALLGHVPIPLLLARWCPTGGDVTDLILVAASDHPGAGWVADLAARLEWSHGGRIAIVAAPARSRDMDRALAATTRIVTCALGESPVVLGEFAPARVVVASAAARTGASLLVAGIGDDAWPAHLIADVARHAGCSTLAVPSPTRAGRRFVRRHRERVLLPM